MTRTHYTNTVLAALPNNKTAIQAKTGLGKTTVHRYITALHAAGDIHITGWGRVANGGPFMAVYTAGPGKDVPCQLKPYTTAQTSRRYVSRARRDGDYADLMARQRARYWRLKAGKQRDPLTAALFGAVKKTRQQEVVCG